MAIVFDSVPTGNRVPAAFVELDPTRALSVQPGAQHRALIVGLKLAAGTAPANKIVEVQGELGGDTLFGTASQLSAMVRAFKRINRQARVYALPVSDNPAGTQATGTIALAGTATAFGVLRTRVGDLRIATAVAIGATAADAATAHAAAINAEPRSVLSAAAAAGTITLTARHKGESGNALTIETEAAPSGLTATDTQPTGGAQPPSLSAPLAAIDDSRYDTIVSAFSDAANLLLLEAELGRRWQPTVKLPCHGFAGARGTYGALSTLGAARNSEHLTIIGAGLSPTPPWVWAAQAAAQDALTCDAQPNRPRNGLVLPDCEAPKSVDMLDTTERNSLLYDGISTYKVDPSGKVMLERLITTYQTNTAGTADASYLAIETMRNLADTMIEFIALASRHDRDLLGPDGTPSAPSAPLTTPKLLRGEIVALYAGRVRRLLAKDLDGFAADLVVELNETDPERIDVHAVPRLVGGLVTQAVKLSFQL